MKFRVSIADAESGWTEIKISDANRDIRIPTSHTPNDFFLELIGALSLAVQKSSCIVTANAEPANFEFQFEVHKDSEQLTFRLVEFADHRRGQDHPGTVLYKIQATPSVIVIPFWRALRTLESRHSPDAFRNAMHKDFPSAKLQYLTEKLSQFTQPGDSRAP